MVNRIWRWHFGQGLVPHARQLRRARRPPGQSGAARLAGPPVRRRRLVDQGDAPADHAVEHLPDERRATTPKAAQVDPENRLLWRFNVRRLEAEAIRDALLAVSGTLDPTMGGSLLHGQEPRLLLRPHVEGRDRLRHAAGGRSTCRSSATTCTTCFQLFDFPDPGVANGDRATTTVAPQALFMMNSELVARGGPRPGRRSAAARRRRTTPSGSAGSTSGPTAGRPNRPSWREPRRSSIGSQAASRPRSPTPHERRLRAWQALCQAILASNEFIYIE